MTSTALGALLLAVILGQLGFGADDWTDTQRGLLAGIGIMVSFGLMLAADRHDR